MPASDAAFRRRPPGRRGPLVVVGDALLDRDLDGSVSRLAPDAPVPVLDEPVEHTRPGGAGLAAALACRLDGREVVLVTALAGDQSGSELAELLRLAGVDVVDLGLRGATPEKVRVRADGRALLRLDRGRRPAAVGAAGASVRTALQAASGVLVSDYGRGVAAEPALRRLLAELEPRVPVVWDPHPLGAGPVPGTRLVTPNAAEAQAAVPGELGTGLAAVTRRAERLLADWRTAAIAVTLGARGALMVTGDGLPLAVPAPAVVGGDPCGAGDRFASVAAGMLADGALPSEAVTEAVAMASAFVAAGGAASLSLDRAPEADPGGSGTRESAAAVIARVRAAGGVVVATGGCFDLLHAGHVRSLEAARALGDCLIVCLNSDASVRRRKGAGRPLVAEQDRASVLAALSCVDAVTIFDEDTPEAILDRLRPDVFAKGADYAAAALPEAELLASWGGQAVVLPYLEGRSTTRLVEEVARRGAR